MRELYPVFVAAALGLWAGTASAQTTICGDRDAITGKLAAEHTETQTALGLTADGRVVEVFASPTGTWTMLITRPDGRACIVTFGENWTVVPVRGTKPVT